jgi:AraC-like DNA-binding protein
LQFDSLRDYSLVTGIGIQVVDRNGNAFFTTDQYAKTRDALLFLANLLDVGDKIEQVKIKSLTRSTEYGGLYTFLDPRGLTFITTPIVKNNNCSRFVIGGPIILSDVDDYLQFEVLPLAQNSTFSTAEVHRIVSAIPGCSPKMVSAFAEQLFVNTAFISGGKLMHRANFTDKLLFATSDSLEQKEGFELSSLRVRSYMYDDERNLNEQYRLLKTLRSQEDIQAKILLNEILEQILFHPRNNLDFIKGRVIELVTIMTQAAVHNGADAKMVTNLRNKASIEIEEHKTLDDIVIWLNDLFELFSSHTFKNPNSKHAEAIKESLAYLLEHYGEKITLNEVAAHVSFSPTYLCTLFKNEMGQSFKSCLNRIRIEKSKELMPNHDLSIADISYKVGFADQSYFARVFKQYEGITPYHYRITSSPAVTN